ncbi:ATP-dependent RNA helicase [Hirschfeldia incana]|nr:ATP-dependent RNA helicase [Hirschfeldia incana]
MDIAMVTKHLERWVEDCSLSNQRRSYEDEVGMTDESEKDHVPILDRTLELNSHISVPSHLEQCLDLKSGEIYYINRNSGMRVIEDPRNSVSNNNADDFSGESDVTAVLSEEDRSLYYESEESSSESSREKHKEEEEEQVLVIAG